MPYCEPSTIRSYPGLVVGETGGACEFSSILDPRGTLASHEEVNLPGEGRNRETIFGTRERFVSVDPLSTEGLLICGPQAAKTRRLAVLLHTCDISTCLTWRVFLARKQCLCFIYPLIDRDSNLAECASDWLRFK